MQKLILFDFDGTIADSFQNFLQITGIILEKYHLPKLSPENLKELRSKSASTVLKKLKIPFYKLPFIARDMKKMQSKSINVIEPFADLLPILSTLKTQGYKLGIVTSNSKENVAQFLKKNNINHFDFIEGNIGLFGKDKRIKSILKNYHLNKDAVLYIGDEIRDIEACKKIGIQIAAVTWGFNTKSSLAKNDPDFLIDKPHQLIKILSIN